MTVFEPRPARLAIRDGRVLLGPEGAAVDVTDAVRRLELVVEAGADVVLWLSAEIADIGLPVTSVSVARDVLDGLTASELDRAIAAGGFSTSPGESVLEHLHARLSRQAD